ncbi:MAG: spore coat protein [Bacillota bacterium]
MTALSEERIAWDIMKDEGAATALYNTLAPETSCQELKYLFLEIQRDHHDHHARLYG